MGSITIDAVRAKLQPPTIAAQVLTRDAAEGLFGHKTGADKKNTTLKLAQSRIRATDAIAGNEILDPSQASGWPEQGDRQRGAVPELVGLVEGEDGVKDGSWLVANS